MSWQPIETAPVRDFCKQDWFMPHSDDFLLWRGFTCVGSYKYTSKGKGRWMSGGFMIQPTHWMPLPAPPEAK